VATTKAKHGLATLDVSAGHATWPRYGLHTEKSLKKKLANRFVILAVIVIVVNNKLYSMTINAMLILNKNNVFSFQCY